MRMDITVLIMGLILPISTSCNSPEKISDELQPDVMPNPPEVVKEMAVITGGTFTIGSPLSEAWRMADEVQHTIIVSDFQIGLYEVSQSQYGSLMGSNPSSVQGDDLPVESVSWLDAIHYCNALSEHEGLTSAYHIDGNTITWNREADGYRLPTEAEWEYACRAGSSTPFNTGRNISASQANCDGFSGVQ